MIYTKRILLPLIAVLLLITLLIPSFASCAEQADGNDSGDVGDNSDNNSDSATDTQSETVSENKLEIPDVKFGDDFVILTPKVLAFNYCLSDFDEPSSDAYEQAYYERNLAIEELFDITVMQVEDDLGPNVYNRLKTSADAGTGDYDICFNNMLSSCTAVGAGYCLSFDNFEYIDLDKSWWNDDCTEQMKLLGKNYMLAGDISLSDKECIWAIYFIKDYIAQYGLQNPYELVNNNEWTWDKMKEMYTEVAFDTNADGVMDKNDIWGLCTHPENYAASWEAAGLKLADVDSDGMPYLTWGEERFFDVFEKIKEIMGDTDRVSTDVYFITTSMREAKTLFATDVIALVREYRVNEHEFGILPYPKYDSDVDRFYSYIAVSSCVLTVGKDCTDTYRTGIITEAMAAYGKDILLPAYYEGQLKSRYARDEESSAMLDIIFNYRCYDLGVFFDWGYTSLNNPDANPATLYSSSSVMYKKMIDRSLKRILS